MKMSVILATAAAAIITSAANACNFTESEFTVANRDAGITLAGTLTVPANVAPKAAIVMATGSGKQNRDEEIYGHRLFKAIAEHLSANGYAVLRLDDRGAGDSQGDFSKSTTDDFVSDISSAVNHLDSCFPNLPVGVIGHSEGGIVAIKTANRNKKCRFIVTLAAPAWAGDSLIMSQCRAMAVAMTGKWDQEQLQRQLLDIAKSNMPVYLAKSAMLVKLGEAMGVTSKVPGVMDKLSGEVDAMLTPWYRSMLRYDPADDITNVAVPWIALNGDRDMQVVPLSLKTISELNKNADTITVKGHNHLFQRCTTGLPQEYETINEDVSPETLDMITDRLDKLFHF